MKKFFLASMIVVVALFSACNDDSDNDVYSCEINMNYMNLISVHGCVEASVQEDIDYVCSTSNKVSPGSGKTGTGCPGNALKTCTGVKEGTAYTAYFYNEGLENKSCDDIMALGDSF